MEDYINFDKPTYLNKPIFVSRPYSDKVVLVAIAKDEDHYIEEWIQYYLKLGVDDIYVYENNWRVDSKIKETYNQLHTIPFDGGAKQLPAYNDFIKKYSKDYGWGMFFDVDEFLALKKYNNVKDWLKNYNDYGAVGVNWRIFGDNGLKKVENNNYSVINRFTKAASKGHPLIKTIINFNKSHPLAYFVGDPHHITVAMTSDYTINTRKTGFVHGPKIFNYEDPDVQLNHYFCKTLEEFMTNKAVRGDATRVGYWDKTVGFTPHNQNEIDDFTAYNFFNDIKGK